MYCVILLYYCLNVVHTHHNCVKNAEFTGFLPYYSMFFSSKDSCFGCVSGHYKGSAQPSTGAGCTMIADWPSWVDPTTSDWDKGVLPVCSRIKIMGLLAPRHQNVQQNRNYWHSLTTPVIHNGPSASSKIFMPLAINFRHCNVSSGVNSMPASAAALRRIDALRVFTPSGSMWDRMCSRCCCKWFKKTLTALFSSDSKIFPFFADYPV